MHVENVHVVYMRHYIGDMDMLCNNARDVWWIFDFGQMLNFIGEIYFIQNTQYQDLCTERVIFNEINE